MTKTAVLLGGILAPAVQIQAAEIHVAINGENSNPGKSDSRTIRKSRQG